MTSVYDYLDYRAFLKAALEERKKITPAFSYRYVAQKIGCNPGFFVKVLQGERNLSLEYTIRLSKILKLPRRDQEFFESLVRFNQSKTHEEESYCFDRLQTFRSARVSTTSAAHYGLYRKWYYVVVRELVHLLQCSARDEGLAAKLARMIEPPVKPAEAKKALEVLMELGVAGPDEKGRLALNETLISTGHDIPSVVVNNILTEFMDLARASIDRFPREERSLSTLTVSVSAEGAGRIREKLDQTRREILDIVHKDEGPLERVYHLNFHFFPVSRPAAEWERQASRAADSAGR